MGDACDGDAFARWLREEEGSAMKEMIWNARRNLRWRRALSWKRMSELSGMTDAGFIWHVLTFGWTAVACGNDEQMSSRVQSCAVRGIRRDEASRQGDVDLVMVRGLVYEGGRGSCR